MPIRRSLFPILAIFALTPVWVASQPLPTRISTLDGPVDGISQPLSTVGWLGIPYAQPPVQALRWRAPQPLTPRSTPLAAHHFGSPCFQPGTASSEDCLFLNIWRPQTRSQKLPVLVYIHGGNNIYGSGDGTWYAAAHFFNAVVVTFNYRLGPFGWFLHPALHSGNPLDDSGNYGTLDQIQLLQWVQNNIEAFGGDPTNVTLAGDSAGAQNVTYLMHSSLARNLFSKVIISSNYPLIRPRSAALKSSSQALWNLIAADHLAPDQAQARQLAASWSVDHTRDFLRGKSSQQILDAYATPAINPIDSSDSFRTDIAVGHDQIPPPLIQSPENHPESIQVIGDGLVIPSGMDFADFSTGHGYPRPAIIGTTRNENHAFNAASPFNFQPGKSLDQLVDEAVHATNPAYRKYQHFYALFGEDSTAAFRNNFTFATNLVDELHTWYGSHLLARNLTHAPHPVPVYIYRFDWASTPGHHYRIPSEDAWLFYMGSPHTSEFDFFYQNFFLPDPKQLPTQYQYTTANLAARRQLSLAIRLQLRQFLWSRSGILQPSPTNHAPWQPWTATREHVLTLDTRNDRADLHMTSSGIARSPLQLYQLHADNPNPAVRDFIESSVLWGWALNWYPQSSVGHFDPASGPNPLFDPTTP